MHILVIKLGSTYPWLSERMGDFEEWIVNGLEAPGRRVEVVSPQRSEALPEVRDVAGAVLTGSHSMVTAREPWSEGIVPWIREALRCEKPLLGICYGHQLLAYATGGAVGYNKRGREFGTTRVHLHEAAGEDPLFEGITSPLAVQVCHAQSVLALPPGAVPIGSNSHDPHQAFRLGRNAWGVQFHPEFSAEATRAYVTANSEELRAEGKNPEEILRNIEETPESGAILGRFGELVDGPV